MNVAAFYAAFIYKPLVSVSGYPKAVSRVVWDVR